MSAPLAFGTVCSGIGAPEAAWRPLGWRCQFMSEIEAFPRAVLSHHYPEVPLHGDFTKIEAGQFADIDVLCGGTPCQSFSVAGLRGGLEDARGNLALEYLRLADRLRPRWLVWENVPGVLSSTSHDAPDPCAPPDDLEEGSEWVGEDEYDADESHAFSCFLAGLSELGYGYAYRVLDAQYFGLAQRRQRVFVVGYLGDWRRAAAVLFEPASLRGHPAPSRKAGERVAPTLEAGANRSGGTRPPGTTVDTCDSLVSMCLNAHPNRLDGESQTFIAHTLRGEGFDASEDGTGRGTSLVPVITGTLTSNGDAHSGFKDANGLVPVSIALRGREGGGAIEMGDDKAFTGGGDKPHVLVPEVAVRRLTPRECERLQGFSDDFTLIPWRGGFASDGPRYKALGNSMAVPVLAWIGRRIQAVDAAE